MPFPTVPPPNGQQAVKIVAGQRIAKATTNYPAWSRAEDAALWLRGQLTVRPTVKLAAETFGVSTALVAEARDWLERREQGKRRLNGGVTAPLSDAAVERIVAEVGVERVWRAIDRFTQPRLPLIAAE